MAPDPIDHPIPPSPREIQDLRRLAAGIIRVQGNRFIKELLRSNKIPIGKNKSDFEHNLDAAIVSGLLTLDHVREWLDDVEGWGRQYVYLYEITPALLRNLTLPKIRQAVDAAGYSDVWNGDTVNEFPDKPKLTSISFHRPVLRLQWQESAEGWTAVPAKNIAPREEGLDTYEYRAYRRVEHRVITRFQAHTDLKLAALFVARPMGSAEHENAVSEARRVIAQLMPIQALDRGQFDISEVSRNLDQQNIPSSANPDPEVRTQKQRLASGGSYIEFSSESKDKPYWAEPAIQNVRNSIRTDQLDKFQGENGMFLFQPDPGTDGLNRELRVQLMGRHDRIRLWAQMTSKEVWIVLGKLRRFK